MTDVSRAEIMSVIGTFNNSITEQDDLINFVGKLFVDGFIECIRFYTCQ